jgi:cell division transport system permease protein
MTVMVLGIAMALPLGLFITLENLKGIDFHTEEWGSITVFMQAGAEAAQVEELLDAINARIDASATAISPEKGMEEFRSSTGMGHVIDVLETNPLPWVLMVRPEIPEGQELAAEVQKLSDWIQAQAGVDAIQLDFKWLQRLAGLLQLGNALLTILTALFSLAVVVVIANTIRMDVANRAEEIEVLSLVGAGDGFIRLPFLYSGFWYGLMGAFLAVVLLSLCLSYLQQPLQSLMDAYGNTLSLSGLSVSRAVIVLAIGGLLGFAGAGMAVERYLWVLRRGGLIRNL